MNGITAANSANVGTNNLNATGGNVAFATGDSSFTGNVSATSDFRGVYSALLEQWFGVDAAAVIPQAASFSRPKLVA